MAIVVLDGVGFRGQNYPYCSMIITACKYLISYYVRQDWILSYLTPSSSNFGKWWSVFASLRRRGWSLWLCLRRRSSLFFGRRRPRSRCQLLNTQATILCFSGPVEMAVIRATQALTLAPSTEFSRVWFEFEACSGRRATAGQSPLRHFSKKTKPTSPPNHYECSYRPFSSIGTSSRLHSPDSRSSFFAQNSSYSGFALSFLRASWFAWFGCGVRRGYY